MARDGSRLLGGSALFLGGRLTGAAATFAVQVLLARWLGAEGLGQYVQAFAACVLLTNLSMLGLGNAALRFVGEALASGDRSLLRGFVRRSRQVVVAVALAIGLLGVLTTGDSFEWLSPWRVAFLCVPVYALMRLHGSLAHAFSWLPLIVLPNTVLRPLLMLGFVAAAMYTGLELEPTGALLVHLAIIGALALAQGWVFQKRFTRQHGAPTPEYRTPLWLGTATPLLLTTLYTAFFPELNLVVAGAWLSDAELGAFHAAYRIALLIAFGVTAVDAAALPRLSRWWADRDLVALQDMLARAARLKVFGGLLALLVLTGAGPWALACFGPGFVSAYPTLWLLAAVQVIRGALGPASELLGVSGHQRACLLVHGVSLAATVALHALLVPVWGLPGAALTVLTVTVVSGLWLRSLVARRLGLETAGGLSPWTGRRPLVAEVR